MVHRVHTACRRVTGLNRLMRIVNHNNPLYSLWFLYLLTLLFATSINAFAGGTTKSEFDADAARLLYGVHCAGCHGLTGAGVVGPSLSEDSLAGKYPDPDEQANVIAAGTARGMPAFEDKLSCEQIKLLTNLTRSF